MHACTIRLFHSRYISHAFVLRQFQTTRDFVQKCLFACIHHTIQPSCTIRHIYTRYVSQKLLVSPKNYGVAISRLLKMSGLFCKRALKELCSAKETNTFKEPTNRSHPLPQTSRANPAPWHSTYQKGTHSPTTYLTGVL